MGEDRKDGWMFSFTVSPLLQVGEDRKDGCLVLLQSFVTSG